MKKESLSIMTVKTLLAVVIFTGIGTIIVGGGYLIGDYYKNKNAIEDKMIKPVVQDKWKICDRDSDCYEYSPCGMGISCLNKMEYEISIKNHVNISCPQVEIMPWQYYWYNKEKCVCSEGICVKVFSKEKYCKSLEDSFKWCGENKPSEYPYDPEESECSEIKNLLDESCISEKNIKDETVDWKTYRNEEYGFEVKYPENWQVDENAIIGSPDAEGISFEKSEKWGFNFYNFGKVSDDDYENLSILEDSNYDKNKEAINVGGVNTNLYMVKNPDDVQMGYPVDVTIRKNGNVYNINGFFNNTKDKEEFIKLLKSILSTFKFIEKYESFTVEGNDIYYGDIKAGIIKVGFIEGDKINIFFEDVIFSFVGDLNKMSLFIPRKFIIFSYDGLGISGGLSRNDSMSSFSMSNITYKCDGPLENLENVKYEYCETNGKDYLTQYEFSDLTSSGFGTGGGTAWRWYKLYIKKINGVDFVFQGHLDSHWIDGPFFYSKEDKEKYKRLSTKKYLDGILTDESVIDKVNKWDEFVESL